MTAMNIYGELPAWPVVFAACDSSYFMEHAPAFIYSADTVGRDVHIHIVNPTAEVLSLAGILNATTVQKVTFSFNDIALRFSPEEARTYYACLRFLVLPTLLPVAGSVLVLDIDCLLMQPFALPEKPCGFFPRAAAGANTQWLSEASKVAAGVVYMTNEALNVAEAVAKTIETIPLNWFADQVALSAIFQQVPVQFVHHFNAGFMDWEFNAGTSIWTGKGPRKRTNERYLAKKSEFDQWRVNTCKYLNVILAPRLDIPFKKAGLVQSDSKALTPLRRHWQNFVIGLYQQLEQPLVIEMPRWTFNNSIQSMFPEGTVFLVPHVERQNWQGNDHTLYYMQTVFPWMFTVDEQGWGGGAAFLERFDPDQPYSDKAFNDLQRYVNAGCSKFDQPQGKSMDPGEPFIFVPLQIPHDETLLWHSSVSCEEFVEALCQWAEQGGHRPMIVFKGHPVNLASMASLKAIISRYTNVLYVTDVDIHAMIPQAEAVYVINSGVGQEAMLHDAKVVTFGQCEYQAATIHGDILSLDATWEQVLRDDMDKRKALYRRWYHWYINDICLSAPDASLETSSAGVLPHG
ncbi:MAG: hypothetical protein SV765_10540 [Pseudomonadota bacterium]|nr:hypothetical protein [Pseudomonadota bacterium]